MYLERIKSIGAPFLDVQFPPTDSALGGDLTDRLVHWRRPKDFSNAKIELFSQNHCKFIWPLLFIGKLIEGQTDERTFITVVQAIAETDMDLIRKLFLTQKPSDQGIYRLRLCTSGSWQEVVIDD